ncbi:MAG: IS1380 family transposase, partial [Actinomycetia bacterium]|nr:IS1380 family transposase [Actinomycetes bacterium]
MKPDSTAQAVIFPDLISKPVVAAFDQEHSSSDGGALLLKAIDEKLGLSEQLAECLRDGRQAGKVRHDLSELVQQRMFAIALGYPDGNDANELADDPIHKMLIGRNPVHGDRLASQSTVSRFENAPGTVELYRLVETIADAVIDRHRRRLGRRAKTVTLDFDPTVDPTHGQQAFSFYHGHYRTHCFLPQVGTIQFNRESKQQILCSVLRPGDSRAALGLVSLLERLLPKVRSAFPGARIRIRLDGGFGTPEV